MGGITNVKLIQPRRSKVLDTTPRSMLIMLLYSLLLDTSMLNFIKNDLPFIVGFGGLGVIIVLMVCGVIG